MTPLSSILAWEIQLATLGGCKESDVTEHRLLKYQIYAPKGSVF